jgi:pilus assembly protein CpaC
VGGGGGGTSSNTQFKKFGIQLAFLPLIQDNDTIRLTVDPEVSSIDTTLGTTLVPGGTPVPGLNTRKSHTTVELKQGETLAIAGLMQISLAGQTARIPGLGDLPYIGAFFSNTTTSRIEKELVVLVTPYLAEPMAPGQVPPGPGDEIKEPNDLEFFFMNRIESRTGIDARSTTMYDDPLHLVRPAILERKYLIGPSGYSR